MLLLCVCISPTPLPPDLTPLHARTPTPAHSRPARTAAIKKHGSLERALARRLGWDALAGGVAEAEAIALGGVFPGRLHRRQLCRMIRHKFSSLAFQARSVLLLVARAVAAVALLLGPLPFALRQAQAAAALAAPAGVAVWMLVAGGACVGASLLVF